MERLKKIMDERGITQYKLAKAIGAKTSTVNNWFTGLAKCPRDNYLNKIASFFHVHPAWLRYGDKAYAPTFDDDVMAISEKLAAYGKRDPQGFKRIGKWLVMLIEGEGPALQFTEIAEDKKNRKRYPIQKKTKGRKTA